VTELTIGSI